MASAKISANAAKSAAKTQSDAANQAQGLNEPYRQAGQTALSELEAMSKPGAFQAPTEADAQNSPGYQARFQAGQQARERAAAARGTLLSGGTMKALERYAQDYASNEYSNVYGRAAGENQNRWGQLSQLAGMGERATASNRDLVTGGANAEAAGTVGSGNAWAGAVSNIGNNLSFMSLINGMQPKGGAPQRGAPGGAGINPNRYYPWAQPLEMNR